MSRFPHISEEYLLVPAEVDPFDDAWPVEIALTDGALPVEADWQDAEWDGQTARLLIADEDPGRYVVWLRITASPEIPVRRAGPVYLFGDESDSWITPDDVTDVYPAAIISQGFIDHVQALAEIVVGTQETPGTKLKAVMVQIAHRLALAPDDNVQQETLGSYSYSRAPGGLGLTKHEKKLLRSAVGKFGLAALSMTRGDVETPGFTDLLEEPVGHDWSEVEES